MKWNLKHLMGFLSRGAKQEGDSYDGIKEIKISENDEDSFVLKVSHLLKPGGEVQEQAFIIFVKELDETDLSAIVDDNLDWRKKLHNGDEVTIDIGDNELPPSIIISTIEWVGDIARIMDMDGNKYECLFRELS